jgi:hypothetical protein
MHALHVDMPGAVLVAASHHERREQAREKDLQSSTAAHR